MQNLKRALAVLLCICLSIPLYSCVSTTKKTEDCVYFINEDEDALQKEEYEILNRTGKSGAHELLEQLGKNTKEEKYQAPISNGVKVQKMELSDGNLVLDFNGAYTELSGIREILSRSAIVLTLMQLEDVQHIAFTIEGVPLMDASGEEIGFMDADSFIQNTGSTLNSYQTATLQLYFADKDGVQLVKETKDVKYNSSVSIEKLIMEQLLKGPAKESHYPTINPQTKIIGISIKDGICYVNLDEEFLNNDYDVKPELTIFSIVNSLINGTDASQVQISVNGEVNVTYKETIDLNQVFSRNDDLIEEGN